MQLSNTNQNGVTLDNLRQVRYGTIPQNLNGMWSSSKHNTA